MTGGPANLSPSPPWSLLGVKVLTLHAARRFVLSSLKFILSYQIKYLAVSLTWDVIIFVEFLCLNDSGMEKCKYLR